MVLKIGYFNYCIIRNCTIRGIFRIVKNSKELFLIKFIYKSGCKILIKINNNKNLTKNFPRFAIHNFEISVFKLYYIQFYCTIALMLNILLNTNRCYVSYLLILK